MPEFAAFVPIPKERLGGIVPPLLRSWPLGRRSGRVATEPYPPPRPSSIVAPSIRSSNDFPAIRRWPELSRGRLSSFLAPHPTCDPAPRRSTARDQPICPPA